MVWSQTWGIGADSLAGGSFGGSWCAENPILEPEEQTLRKGGGLMPEHDGSAGDQPTQPVGAEAADEHARPVVTRRDFIAGAGLGVAATAIVAGGVAVATRQGVQTAPAPVAQTAPGGPAVVAPAPATGAATQAQPQPAAAAKPAAAPAANQ